MKLRANLCGPAAIGVASFLSIALPVLSQVPVSADISTAPPLTATQLQELHQVTSWRIEIHRTITAQGSGGGSGLATDFYGDAVSSWSQAVSYTQTIDATFTVSGPGGCVGSALSGGCRVNYSAPNSVNLSYQDRELEGVTYVGGCPDANGGNLAPNPKSITFSNTASGSLTLDGTTGNQATGPFFIDYSTNPPRTESDVFTSDIPGTVTYGSSSCGQPSSRTNQVSVAAGDLGFFFGNNDPNFTDNGGDTQVRVINGQFVVQGAMDGSETINAFPSPIEIFIRCANGASNCQPTWPHVNSDTETWLATATIPLTAPPVVTVPASPLIAEASGPDGAPLSFNATATAADGTTLPVKCAPASGSIFPLGSTTVTCTATDVGGNVGTATFTVLVRDTTPPDLTLPSDITVNATSPHGAQVLYDAAAVDLVDGPVPVNCFPPSGTIFPIGSTTVGCSAADSHGNTATGSFNVHVKGATEQLNDLVTLVSQNNSDPGTSLVDQLQAVMNAVAVGATPTACGDLQAFINHVQAQTGKKLTTDQAAALVADAKRIMGVLGC